jgi:hypothetical protein
MARMGSVYLPCERRSFLPCLFLRVNRRGCVGIGTRSSRLRREAGAPPAIVVDSADAMRASTRLLRLNFARRRFSLSIIFGCTSTQTTRPLAPTSRASSGVKNPIPGAPGRSCPLVYTGKGFYVGFVSACEKDSAKNSPATTDEHDRTRVLQVTVPDRTSNIVDE